MCGIYGSTIPYVADVIEKKMTLMSFRGPDHRCWKHFPRHNLVLGHVRLSILDLDCRSNQPFVYSPATSIVFNGEIYNYRELAQRFLSGVPLRTTSDTEILCALYEKMGSEMLKYLNGMFAFVIYDSLHGLLWGARDRLGLKPFYYRYDDCGFEFASQLSVLKCGASLHINATARQLFLLNRFVPDPYAIYSEVQKLRAGQTFTYWLDSNQIELQNYWDLLDNSCGFTKPGCYEDAKETLEYLIEDAVKIRLHADVPIGLFLSGGVDSSLVTALAVRQNANLKAYTVGFENVELDESSYAIEVARNLGIDIQVSRCVGSELEEAFVDYERFFDEPFADNSLIPSCLVSKTARSEVKVVLGGDGGDEQFMGYLWYRRLKLMKRFYYLPVSVRRLITMIGAPFFKPRVLDKWEADTLQQSYLSAFHFNFYDTDTMDLENLLLKEPDISWLNNNRGLMSFSDYDIKHFLNSDINTKTDRSSMRYGLELRSPLLDYRITEYSRLLPYEYLYDRQWGEKRILKDILSSYIPAHLIARPKQGFESPIGKWLRFSHREQFLQFVTKENIQSLLPELHPEKFMKLRDQFMSDSSVSPEPFWRVFTYILWFISQSKL